MNFDTIIFDLDGTLLNSLADLADSVNYVLTQKGYPTRSYEEIKSFVGAGVKELILRSLPNGTDKNEVEVCLELFKDYYSKNVSMKTHPYEGVYPLLQELQNKNIKMAIVSNKSDPDVQVLLEIFFKDYITVAIGDRPDLQKKPAPDSIYEVLRRLDFKSEKALYIGDTEVDIETAKNANLFSLSVTWGFRSEKDLLANGAEHLVHHPKEILDFLHKEAY
jgi:phosphoglycolate phosphatase